MTDSQNSSDSNEDLLQEWPLRKILRAIGVSSLLSFFVSELFLFYFLSGGIFRFPENLIVVLLFLSVEILLLGKFLPASTGLLTYYTSIMTLIFMVNWFFQSSTNPSLSVLLLKLESGQDPAIFFDYILIGLVGGTLWMLIVSSFMRFLRVVKRTSIRVALSSFRTSVSRVVKFFDKHPWLAPVLLSALSILVGFLIGIWRP